MIRKNLINCKLFRVKKSTKILFEACMASFRPETEICPVCHCKGNCRIHGYYERYVIDFMNGKPSVRKIRVMRVICSCSHTHAILPDPIIPYASYSLFFILRVLLEYSTHRMTVSGLCEKFSITPAMLYRWKTLYEEHRREWQGLLGAVTEDLFSSLRQLAAIDPFSTFAICFFQMTGISFLQSHRNPALFPQRPDPPE